MKVIITPKAVIGNTCMKNSDYCAYVFDVSHYYAECRLICAVSCSFVVFYVFFVTASAMTAPRGGTPSRPHVPSPNYFANFD